MRKTVLGKSGLCASSVSFGCIPIQRISEDEAVSLLRYAYDCGVNFFDTARAYTDSERKLGLAMRGMRKKVIIATKTMAKNAGAFWDDLKESLNNLNTDYIDLYQLHNPEFLPVPGGEDGLYDALIKAKKKGMIRHTGISCHMQDIAKRAVLSGLYETLQYPLSCLSTGEDEEMARLCEKTDTGFIAMKGMAGGLIRNSAAAFCYIASFPNVVPIWGIENRRELDEFLKLEKDAPALDDDMRLQIQKEREELSGEFCRGCGYCMPCPAGIHISVAARIDKLMTRSLAEPFLEPRWRENMARIEQCTMCAQCEERCPYHLKTYELLKRQLKTYRDFCERVDGENA